MQDIVSILRRGCWSGHLTGTNHHLPHHQRGMNWVTGSEDDDDVTGTVFCRQGRNTLLTSTITQKQALYRALPGPWCRVAWCNGCVENEKTMYRHCRTTPEGHPQTSFHWVAVFFLTWWIFLLHLPELLRDSVIFFFLCRTMLNRAEDFFYTQMQRCLHFPMGSL
jgi:hypothetical protein